MGLKSMGYHLILHYQRCIPFLHPHLHSGICQKADGMGESQKTTCMSFIHFFLFFFSPSTSIRKDLRPQIQGHKEKGDGRLKMAKGSGMSSPSCRTSEQSKGSDHQHRMGPASVTPSNPLGSADSKNGSTTWHWPSNHSSWVLSDWLHVFLRGNSGTLEKVPRGSHQDREQLLDHPWSSLDSSSLFSSLQSFTDLSSVNLSLTWREDPFGSL